MGVNIPNFTPSRFPNGATHSSCVLHAQAKVPANVRTWLTMNVFRIGVFVVLVALTLFANPEVARAQNSRGCAWPLDGSPEGFGNMAAPDNFARYWIMPFEKQYDTMTIKGAYPNARYFSFVAYDGQSPVNVAGSLFDAQIAPDAGSINPFVSHDSHHLGNNTYTVVISRSAETSGNTIKVSADVDWVILRLYVAAPDPSLSGLSLSGGVPLPSITLTGQGGDVPLQLCSPVNKLVDVETFLQQVFPPPFDLPGDEGAPLSDRLWFAAPTVPPVRLFPNPNNKYIITLPGNYQPGRIIVIHGKAPGTPGAKGSRHADVRYWSLCNNDFALPVSVVNCTADPTADLERGFYTIVISDDLLRPDWLPSNINWLAWGDGYPKLMFFRNMLPDPDFSHSIQSAVEQGCTFELNLPNLPDRAAMDDAGQCAQKVMGDYYPVAAWCDKSTFVHGGWQACIKMRRERH